MSETTIGLQLYTLRDFLNTPKEIETTLKKVKSIGYDAVEAYSLSIPDVELAQMFSYAGLKVAGVHTGFDEIRDDPGGVVDRQKLWGSSHVVIPVTPEEYRNGEGFRRFAKDLSDAAEPLVAEGLSLSYHNHSYELERFDDRVALDILIEDSDADRVFFEVDTYWIQHGGGDPSMWIRKVAGRIRIAHFKDLAIAGDDQGMVGGQVFAEVGEGNLNWPEILTACREARVEWYVVEQDLCRRDPFESIAISLRNMKAMGLR